MDGFDSEWCGDDDDGMLMDLQPSSGITLREWQHRAKKYFFDNDGNCIFQVSTGCLTADTLIDLPRDNKKYPNGIKISELVNKKDFHVYSYNINKRCIELKKVKNVWLSKKNADVYKITTKSGKTIKATDNHPFLVDIKQKPEQGCGRGKREIIVSQQFIKLKFLKKGMFLSMWPRSYYFCNGGYTQFKKQKNKRIQPEHRFIAEQLFGDVKYKVVHHKDNNKLNNNIENLEVISVEEHSRTHTQKRGFFGRQLWEIKGHPKGFKDKKHKDYDGLKKNKQVENFKIFSDEWKHICGLNSKKGLSKLSSEELSDRASKCSRQRYSDKIISIEYVGQEDVYDMEVSDNHNFIANDFIVHNSGKTFIAIDIIQEVLERHDNDIRVLVIVPKNVILETGWYKELTDYGIPIQDIGVYYGNIREFSTITLTNMQNINKIPLEMFDMVVADECFSGDTRVLKMNKHPYLKNKNGMITSTSIQYIVEHKLPGPVVSFNTETKSFELKKITNWFKIPEKRAFIHFVFEDGSELKVTTNQKIYNGAEYKIASDINIGDYVMTLDETNNVLDDNDIKQLFISGILGDGCVNVVRDKARILFNGIKKEYIEFKRDIFNKIEQKKMSSCINQGYKKNIIYKYTSNLYSDFLVFYNKFKHEGIDFLLQQLDEFGLMLWFYDDGSFSKNSGSLSTHSFSFKENEKIMNYLLKKGIDCSIQKAKKRDGRVFFYIRFRKKGVEQIKKILNKYSFSCYNYKYDGLNIEKYKYNRLDMKFDMDSLNNVFKNYKRSNKRPGFKKITHKTLSQEKIQVYDIEVEGNHNFFANGVLSHNCHNYSTPRMLEYLNHPFKYKLGLTATLSMHDGKHLKLLKLFDYNRFIYEPKQALNDGILNPFVYYNIGVKLDPASMTEYEILTQQLNNILKIGGGYNAIMRSTSKLKLKMLSVLTERKKLVNNYQEKFDVTRQIIAKNPGKKIIVFNQYNDQTSKLYWHLLDDDVNCRVMHSGIKQSKREQDLIDFKNDKYNVLLTSKVLDEGYNLPKLDMAIIMAGDSTDKQTIQRMGRVLRKKKGVTSKLYQIYCCETIEESASKERSKIFKSLASDYREFEHHPGMKLNL